MGGCLGLFYEVTGDVYVANPGDRFSPGGLRKTLSSNPGDLCLLPLLHSTHAWMTGKSGSWSQIEHCGGLWLDLLIFDAEKAIFIWDEAPEQKLL